MGERRAWGWVAALRAGTTTPWADWAGESDRTGRTLPGAQQLELLRRLNLAGLAERPDATLAERVLSASAPGRGRPDLELVGAVEPSAWGPRPVDPAGLPDDELLRVATNLLAEDVADAGLPDAGVPRTARLRTRGWPRPRPYRLVGVPWLADPVRDELRRRGRPPGGRRPAVHVVGTDLATMLRLAWTASCFDEGGPTWADWAASALARRRLPPRADLTGMAAAWAERVGERRVHVVLDPGALPRLLGVRALPATPIPSADATDLARRVAAPLGQLVLPARRADLLRRTLLPRVLEHGGGPLGLDAAQLGWARERGERMRATLAAAGYAVVGGPHRVLPDPDAAPDAARTPDDARVLDLATRLLLDKGR